MRNASLESVIDIELVYDWFELAAADNGNGNCCDNAKFWIGILIGNDNDSGICIDNELILIGKLNGNWIGNCIGNWFGLLLLLINELNGINWLLLFKWVNNGAGRNGWGLNGKWIG